MLNFTSLVVAIMGIFWLSENPSPIQWIGSALFITGIIIYFFPISLSGNQSVGLLIMLIGILANADSSIIGRDINKRRDISPLVVTFISMGIGAIILIIIGISTNGGPVMESSIINGTMLIQIAILAAYFPGENLSFQKVIGMIIAGGGAVLVQIKKGISVSKGLSENI